MTAKHLKAALLTAALAALGGSLLQSQAPAAGEWAAYGANNAGSKYSPLDQINKETVKGLRIAWRQSAIPTPVGRCGPTHKCRAITSTPR